MKTLSYRKICLLMEVETSIKLLKKGMGDLQRISGANDFYHAPILLLSSGYERLIKCLLCLALMDDAGFFQSIPYEKFKRKGHDIEYLLHKLLSICSKKEYSSKFVAAKTDIDFLSDDKRLRKIITLLSEFAQGGRYYNLDIVVDGSSSYKNPSDVWEELETSIIKDKGDFKTKINERDIGALYEEVNRELVITLEKFTRVLARLFTKADFGDFARQVSPLVYDYLMLRDNDLGKRDYRNSKMKKKGRIDD